MGQGKESGDLYRVIYKEGTHLASSNETDGAFRGNLLDNDTNKLVAHAEWVKVDKSEYESYEYQESSREVELSKEQKEMAALLGEILAAGTVWVFSEVVAPHVKHWWQDKAAPSIKQTWNSITNKKKTKQTQKGKNNNQVYTTKVAAQKGTVPDILFDEIDEAYKKYVNNMTSEEAQKELIDIFVLSAILTAKIRKLSNARIRKDGGMIAEYIDGQKVIEKLSSAEFIDSINGILENNRSLLDEKVSISLSEILGRNLVLDGQYVPIENNRFKEALVLTTDTYENK
jgi:hypothetical protein